VIKCVDDDIGSTFFVSFFEGLETELEVGELGTLTTFILENTEASFCLNDEIRTSTIFTSWQRHNGYEVVGS
jgi:hypothetical protein